jgi:hypothetical protein
MLMMMMEDEDDPTDDSKTVQRTNDFEIQKMFGSLDSYAGDRAARY